MQQIKILNDGFYNGHNKKEVLLRRDDILNVDKWLDNGYVLARTTVENKYWGIPVGTYAAISDNNFVVIP